MGIIHWVQIGSSLPQFRSKVSCPKTATRGVLCKKVFLETSQNSQENTCQFCEISNNISFTEHVWTTASTLLLFIHFFCSHFFTHPPERLFSNFPRFLSSENCYRQDSNESINGIFML